MNLRCPECCSEEVAAIELGARLECGNCGAGFAPGEAFVAVAEAEAAAGPGAQAPPSFRFDRDRAAASLGDSDGELWPVNAYSDADELHSLSEAAQNAEILRPEDGHAWIYVYPMSISEPEPLLAVDLGRGPTLLGHSLKLREAEGEDPMAFTLRFLADLATEASALAAAHRADGDCLDRIAAYMNRPGQWSGADVCEFVATELQVSGRELLDNAED